MNKKLILAILLGVLSSVAHSSGSGQTVQQIYYCGDDFAMKMSGGDWYLVKKSQVGEQKLNHFLSMALFMMASGKETANVFPGDPESWCGNQSMRPIRIFSVTN